MNMISVSSSAVESIGWEDEVMYVRFTSGSTYAYYGVSFDTYESIKDSSSIGRAVGALGVHGVLV